VEPENQAYRRFINTGEAFSETGKIYNNVLFELAKIFHLKDESYTNGVSLSNYRKATNFGVRPWVASLIRASDKMSRLETFASGTTLNFESAEDSLIDLANHAIIALILLREENDELKAEIEQKILEASQQYAESHKVIPWYKRLINFILRRK